MLQSIAKLDKHNSMTENDWFYGTKILHTVWGVHRATSMKRVKKWDKLGLFFFFLVQPHLVSILTSFP